VKTTEMQPGNRPRGRVTEVRCRVCGALLGKLEGGGLQIRRGDLSARFDGRFQAELTCYRPRCRTVTVLHLDLSPI